MRWLIGVLLLCAAAWIVWPANSGFGEAAADQETGGVDGMTELLDAELSAWVVENAPEENFSMSDDGVLRVSEPSGWLRSRERYADFRLRVEFRFLTDNADSGIFVRASSDETFARGWPRGSYQMQMLNPVAGDSPFPPIGAIFRHGVPQGTSEFDAADAERLSLGTGEWQVLEIELEGETLKVWLNDELLSTASGIETPGEYLGIQGETGELEFRSIAIRHPLTSACCIPEP